LAKRPTPPTRSGLLTEARHVVLPKGIKSTAFPAAEATCRQLGLGFDPWQADLNRAILGKAKGGLYAADTVVISIPRQVGKTWDIGALVFADCIINPGTTTVWTAHRFKVARETFDSLKAVALSLALAPHIDPDDITTAAGNEQIRFRNGSRIVFAARERGAIRGFTKVRRLILDEAQILTEHALSDLAPTMNQAENPQIILMGTPPKPTDPGEVFTRLRSEALAGETDGLLFVEFSADADADPDDEAQWAKANPSYPKRTPKKAILRLRKLLSLDDFMREALGIWDSDGRALVMPNWSNCSTTTEPEQAAALGIAVDIDRVWISLGAASGGEVPHLGLVWRRRLDVDRDFIIGEAARIQAETGCAVVIDRKGPAGSLEADLDEALNLTVVGLDDYVTACADLYDAVEAKEVTHGDYPELNAAVANAGKRAIGDRWAWSRKSGDISPLESVTLAHQQANSNYDPLDSIG
jgi:hypothetical protein